MIHKRHGYQRGKWNGLGGKIEPGESPEECARREVYEESGLLATELRLNGFITFPLFDTEDDWYVFVFTCTGFDGQPRSSAEGDLHWIPDEQLDGLELHEGDRVFLPWLERDGVFSAKLIYDKGEFRRHEVVFY